MSLQQDDNLLTREIKFCEAYNRRCAEAAEVQMEVQKDMSLPSAEMIEEYERELMNTVDAWFDAAQPDWDGLTPARFIETLPDAELPAFFDICATKIDRNLPDPVKIRLGRSAAACVDALRERALAIPFAIADEELDDEAYYLSFEALKLLGEWRDETTMLTCLRRIEAAPAANERMADALKVFFEGVGEAAPEGLLALSGRQLDAAREGQTLSPWNDYVLIYLVGAGRKVPSEALYQMLRRAFRERGVKVIPAICLGDYGDRRAVTLLRASIERSADTMDRQLYYEVLSSIKRLGGVTADLPNPFRPNY